MTTAEFARQLRREFGAAYKDYTDEELVTDYLKEYPEERHKITDLVAGPRDLEIMSAEKVPATQNRQPSLPRYKGILAEPIDRIKKRQIIKTRAVDLELYGQENAAAKLAIENKQLMGHLDRVDDENEVASLELTVKKETLLTQAEEQRRKRDRLRNPSPHKTNPRNITVDADPTDPEKDGD